MYLADKDIRGILDEINFHAPHEDHPFVENDQIQPCSVDLRLDNTFWIQTRRRLTDLRKSKLLELSPRRYWRKTEIGSAGSIDLKPGQMILGRTYETFSIPSELAGKLEGRSSFARLGLGVHIADDFINPGWRGQMPLKLVNFGRNTLRLVPYLPVCQLMLIRVSSRPDRVYGDKELASKYMNDDGGPSYWWRDKRISALHKWLGEHDVAQRIQEEILQLLGPREPELIERFEKCVRKLPGDALTNADNLLDRFAKREARSRLTFQILRGVQVGLFPLLIASSIGSLFSEPFGWLHYALWLATVASIPVTVLGLRTAAPDFLMGADLAKLRAARQNPAAA